MREEFVDLHDGEVSTGPERFAEGEKAKKTGKILNNGDQRSVQSGRTGKKDGQGSSGDKSGQDQGRSAKSRDVRVGRMAKEE